MRQTLLTSAATGALLALALSVAPAQAQQRATAAANRPALAGDVQGMSRERLARITSAMRQQVENGTFAGAVTLVARRGEVVHFEAHGFLDAAKSKPMQKDAMFRLASMTKPIVSIAAMMLIERGDMALQDPLAKWLPELKDLKVEVRSKDKDGKDIIEDVAPNRPPTIQDLLRHTAGLVYASRTKSPRIKEMYAKAGIEAREKEISGDDMLKALGQIPLANQPGTTWEYSIATDVLGLVIERVAKKPLDMLVKELLLDPLGMKDTHFRLPPEKAPRVAEWLPSDTAAGPMGKSYAIHFDPASKSYFRGGAGMIGTAQDYLKLAQMVVNGGELNGRRYLSKKTTELMLSSHTTGIGTSNLAVNSPGYGFGLGWAVRLDEGMGVVPGSKGDAMWAGAWGTSFWVDPKEGLVGILMSQAPSKLTDTRVLMRNLTYGAVVK